MNYDIIVVVCDDIYLIFRAGTKTPASKEIQIKNLENTRNKKLSLFIRNGMRMYCFAAVPLTEVPGVSLSFPLEITFKILVSGMVEIYWETGSARIIYDKDELDLNAYVRRQNLRDI